MSREGGDDMTIRELCEVRRKHRGEVAMIHHFGSQDGVTIDIGRAEARYRDSPRLDSIAADEVFLRQIARIWIERATDLLLFLDTGTRITDSLKEKDAREAKEPPVADGYPEHLVMRPTSRGEISIKGILSVPICDDESILISVEKVAPGNATPQEIHGVSLAVVDQVKANFAAVNAASASLQAYLAWHPALHHEVAR